MKRTIYAGIIILGSMSLLACERTNKTTDAEADAEKGVVVERDSVPTEYEVTETVVEYDTTKRTKTVDAQDMKKEEDKKDAEVKKD